MSGQGFPLEDPLGDRIRELEVELAETRETLSVKNMLPAALASLDSADYQGDWPEAYVDDAIRLATELARRMDVSHHFGEHHDRVDINGQDMSEYRAGDRVLVSAEVLEGRDGWSSLRYATRTGATIQIQSGLGIDNYDMQPDPGVPVADLLEEIELLWDTARYECGEHGSRRLKVLKRAREMASASKMRPDGRGKLKERMVAPVVPTQEYLEDLDSRLITLEAMLGSTGYGRDIAEVRQRVEALEACVKSDASCISAQAKRIESLETWAGQSHPTPGSPFFSPDPVGRPTIGKMQGGTYKCRYCGSGESHDECGPPQDVPAEGEDES